MADKIKYMGVNSTQELINLLKADLAKKQDIIQFTEMPDPVDCVGRTFQYVGETNMQFTNGHFYHSNGFTWEETYKGLDGKTWEIVDSLPSWSAANYDTIYFVYEDGSLTGYVKGIDKMECITSDKTWAIVNALPPWATAESDTMYLVLSGSTLKLYVKNPDVTDEWYELGGGKSNFNELENIPTINGIPLQNTDSPDEATEIELKLKSKKYPDSPHYDPSAIYPSVAEGVRVNELELESFTDEEITELWEEV